MKTKSGSGVWYISSVNTVRKIAVAEASWLMLSSTLLFAELPDLSFRPREFILTREVQINEDASPKLAYFEKPSQT